MFSEIHAELTAKSLEKVLLEGTKLGNSTILDFLGKNLYPLYLREVEECCGSYNIPPEIRKVYSNF